jgi:polyhydroxyalkanoate synthase
VLDALDATRRICRAERTVLTGVCSGGMLASMVAAQLAGVGQLDRLAGLAFMVTVLDHRRAGIPAALADRYLARAATAISRRKGYLDGKLLAEVFAWLRPGDLVWNYWVNNYLLGRKPPAFDVLYWNADTTRMPARLHADLVDVALANRMAKPASGLKKVSTDTYVVAGIADHITPWQNCYRTTGLLGGPTRFVLSSSGHIAAMVNPPGSGKSSYRLNPENPGDPQEWLGGASTEQGSWWPDFVAWLTKRSGAEKRAPRNLGGRGLDPLIEAPGTYVLDR